MSWEKFSQKTKTILYTETYQISSIINLQYEKIVSVINNYVCKQELDYFSYQNT